MTPARIVTPAEIVNREIEARGGMSKIETFLTPPLSQVLKDVAVDNRPIRIYEANRLAQIFNTSSEFWLTLQEKYDASNEKRQIMTLSAIVRTNHKNYAKRLRQLTRLLDLQDSGNDQLAAIEVLQVSIGRYEDKHFPIGYKRRRLSNAQTQYRIDHDTRLARRGRTITQEAA